MNLSDIFTAPAAPERDPLPPGEYECRIAGARRATSNAGKPSLKLTLEVVAGGHAGKRVWYDIWLTGNAQRHAVRDLAKLGITDNVQLTAALERGLPAVFVCAVTVERHTADSGAVFNKVARFDVLRSEQAKPDPFAPPAEPANRLTASHHAATPEHPARTDEPVKPPVKGTRPKPPAAKPTAPNPKPTGKGAKK